MCHAPVDGKQGKSGGEKRPLLTVSFHRILVPIEKSAVPKPLLSEIISGIFSAQNTAKTTEEVKYGKRCVGMGKTVKKR